MGLLYADKISDADLLWPHREEGDAMVYERINGKDYFRFSGKGDHVHFSTENGLLCGKAGLSHNYEQYKPKTPICPKCLKIATETK